MRKPIIVGNWKMNKTNSSGVQFVNEIEPLLHNKADFGVAPSFAALGDVRKVANNLIIAAQNVHFEDSGAFTGEVSVEMLADINVNYVIIGHSERRQMFNETDKSVNLKVKQAIKHGLNPIVCCGETLEQFEDKKTEVVVRNQVTQMLEDVDGNDVKNLVIAYEPIWAIGTGKSATLEIAQDTCAIVRDQVKVLYNQEVADSVRIQYGGSVKPDNIKQYLEMPDIDGALIGGASLEVASFKEIIYAIK